MNVVSGGNRLRWSDVRVTSTIGSNIAPLTSTRQNERERSSREYPFLNGLFL
jgi:hypothetical protein